MRSTIPVAVRRDPETGRPVLFFRNSNGLGWHWLECYDRIGQHSQADEGYRLACKPEPMPLADDAAALVREWNNQGPDNLPKARIVQRLPRN